MDAVTTDETDETVTTRTFADAVQERYGDPLAGSGETLLVGPPGFDRKVDLMLTSQKQIEQLTKRIALSRMRIESVGKVSDEMIHRLREVKELDLSFNALPQWPTVTEIVSKLPACEELIVTGNPQMAYACDFPYSDVVTFKKRMHNVKTIVMGSCEYQWQWMLCTALEVWSQSLQSLSLHGNRITDLTAPPGQCFAELQSLDLSGNPIGDWNQVCKLGSLPALRELSVSECKIEVISFEGQDTGSLFASLKKLNVSHNRVESWIDVAELRQLRALDDLNLKGNPVIAGVADYATSFNLVLGRLTGLVKLNGEVVSEEMYREAEKYYFKVAFKESTKCSPGKEFHASHPRFKDLLQVYGVPDEAPARLKHVCINLLAEDGNEITKKLPCSTTVSSLKVLMKRTFGLDPTSETDLVLKTRKEDEYEYVLNEDDSPLSFYDVGNGDFILIKSK